MSCFRLLFFRYFLNDFGLVPVAPIVTGLLIFNIITTTVIYETISITSFELIIICCGLYLLRLTLDIVVGTLECRLRIRTKMEYVTHMNKFNSLMR